MNILHIDNINLFTADMLLGALIDMGASVFYIQNSLKDMGIDACVLHDTVRRDGMEAEYAYVKVNSISEQIKIPDDIKGIILNCADDKEKSPEETGTLFAVLFAINTFCPDYITCNDIDISEGFDKQLLKCIVNEQTNSKYGDIICVGYGAGEKDILRVVLYKSGNHIIFEQILEESLL